MLTLEEIRREGLDALKERLGRAGMVRFLQLFESGSGDYVMQRRAWVDRTSVPELQKIAPKPRPRKSPRKS